MMHQFCKQERTVFEIFNQPLALVGNKQLFQLQDWPQRDISQQTLEKHLNSSLVKLRNLLDCSSSNPCKMLQEKINLDKKITLISHYGLKPFLTNNILLKVAIQRASPFFLYDCPQYKEHQSTLQTAITMKPYDNQNTVYDDIESISEQFGAYKISKCNMPSTKFLGTLQILYRSTNQ